MFANGAGQIENTNYAWKDGIFSMPAGKSEQNG